jgi:hypothetical protein
LVSKKRASYRVRSAPLLRTHIAVIRVQCATGSRQTYFWKALFGIGTPMSVSTTSIRQDETHHEPPFSRPQLRMWSVRLEGFEPPTLGSVGTFRSKQLRHLLLIVGQIVRKEFMQVQGCSIR